MSRTTGPWRMPAETGRQDRVFMAFPPLGESFGHTDDQAEDARAAWASVANATVDFVPVTMLVNPPDAGHARRLLSHRVQTVQAPLDDAWMRDIGPTFVVGQAGQLGAVTWEFNGWGKQPWARWGRDRLVGRIVADLAGAQTVESALVNEGGGIHVDGEGTVLLTDTVQLDRGRNPDWSRRQVETELSRTLGADRFVWFPRGLHRDAQRFGTHGHVDILATIPAPGTLLVHRQHNPAHPDFHLADPIDATIADNPTADGAPWRVIDLPAPETARDDDGWVDYSYINHLVTNDAVICCTFDDPADRQAQDILAVAYPGREIVGVDARTIFRYGGGVHCITQQLPAVGIRAGGPAGETERAIAPEERTTR